MKFQLEGDPAEIVAFFQQLSLQAQGSDLSGSTAFIIAPAPTADTQAEAVEEQQEEQAPRAPEMQLAVKDRITQFLESRKRAKVSDIAKGTGLSTKRISPRLAELVNGGFVERATHGAQDNDYRFVRPWTRQSRTTKRASAKLARRPQSRVAPPPAMEEAPVFVQNYDPKSLKGSILCFLASRETATMAEIATAAGGSHKYRTVTSRMVSLRQTGKIQKIDKADGPADYALVRDPTRSDAPIEVTEETPPSPSVAVDPQHVEYLRIMGAIVDAKYATYVGLERATGMSRKLLSTRLIELERRNLVERKGGSGRGAVTFKAVPPTRANDMPLPYNSLSEAVVEAIKQYPGSTAANIAIRLMKSYSDVARRLHDLQKTTVDRRDGLFYPR